MVLAQDQLYVFIIASIHLSLRLTEITEYTIHEKVPKDHLAGFLVYKFLGVQFSWCTFNWFLGVHLTGFLVYSFLGIHLTGFLVYI